ncbi:histidine kinase [Kineosporia sp. NBRC 101677]|uniref:sensor histidine kinase n=1 Tax=Kineosporia sp. NBRC 101677 TaxID=3032197 RepID=UPI0025572271|nr:histidine kinase [Kineosporia sp. NBRC 101677]
MTSPSPRPSTSPSPAVRVAVFLRDRVLPPGRPALVATAVGLSWALAMYWLPRHGWYPGIGVYEYQALGAVITLVLLTRDRFPRLTLIALALFYPDAYGSWLSSNWHILPYALAGYTVAARGAMRAHWGLLVGLFGVFRHDWVSGPDWQSWPLLSLLQYPEAYSFWDFNFSRTALFGCAFVATVLLGRASYRQEQANQELRRRQEEVERLRKIETDQMVMAERTRIARELHDVVAHHISAVVLRAQAADRVADAQPEQLREAVRWIALDGQHTLAAMRQVVKVLRSTDSGAALAPQTTLAEIPEIAARMQAVGMPVQLGLPPIQPILPAAVELAAVRIVQEALTNALIHARAGQALVALEPSGDQLVIEVHDDGGRGTSSAEGAGTRWSRRAATQPSGIPAVGAATGQPMPVGRSSTFGSGHGLVGMRERAASCDGTLEIGRSHLGGWLVRARLTTAVSSESLMNQAALPHAG